MDSIISQVTSLANGADELTRKKLIDTLRGLSYTIESPDDTITRLWGSVSALELV